MIIFNTKKEWDEIRIHDGMANETIGFVPTMGALHEGHLSLIRKSLSENEITVVSIYVNPTQFNDKNDFNKYPDLFEIDKNKLDSLNVDFLFKPTYDDIYPDKFNYEIHEKELSGILCGKFRVGHFSGVLTIVMKLLNIIKPSRAYFGEKDFQQYMLIKSMTDAFFMDVKIIPCPIIREADGLAMSSRNLLLTSEERLTAAEFPKVLNSNISNSEKIKELEARGFKVEYITDFNSRRFGAVYLGKVRLIDNVEL